VHYPGGAWETTVGKRVVCTNPLGSFEGWAPRESHLGSLLYVDGAGRPITPRVEARLSRARCIDGVLEVERTVPFRYRQDPLGRDGDLHLSDYPLFFLDVREDVARRARAFRELSETPSRHPLPRRSEG